MVSDILIVRFSLSGLLALPPTSTAKPINRNRLPGPLRPITPGHA